MHPTCTGKDLNPDHCGDRPKTNEPPEPWHGPTGWADFSFTGVSRAHYNVEW